MTRTQRSATLFFRGALTATRLASSAKGAAGVHWCLGRLGNLAGDMRALLGRPFKCSACGSLDVSLWLFARRAEADAWSEESGPGF